MELGNILNNVTGVRVFAPVFVCVCDVCLACCACGLHFFFIALLVWFSPSLFFLSFLRCLFS